MRNACLASAVSFKGGLSLTGTLHNVRADKGGFIYGNEIDLQLIRKIGRCTLSLKHAGYFGHDVAAAGAAGIDKSVNWAFIDYAL